MSFEEQFPNFGEMDYFINWNDGLRGLDKELIQERMLDRCLDKAKVKEVIEEHFTEHNMGTVWCHIWKKQLLKGLGLQ